MVLDDGRYLENAVLAGAAFPGPTASEHRHTPLGDGKLRS